MLQNEKNPHDHARSYTIKKRKPIFFYTRMITIHERSLMVHEFFNTIGLSTITLIPLFLRGGYYVKI